MPQPRFHLAALTAAIALALAHSPTYAADSKKTDEFTLGAINVIGKHSDIGEVGSTQVGSVVTSDEMSRFNRYTVGDALNLLPGVTTSVNSRNEKTIAVRGFDSRQVPLFIDGIPVYVPYDGYVDFNRFSTADLSTIQVSKGFSSVAYGPNTLGGAINLVSRKPVAALEGDVSIGFTEGAGQRTAANLGTNQGLWYLQTGLSYTESNGFPLSSDFDATKTESGGLRDNSQQRDSKMSLKLGLTPNDTDEYALSYYQQNGEKGQPPSTDPSVARYWQWPYWDKESLYFISKTALGDYESVKLRLYHDSFDNEVRSYTDNSYTTLKPSGKGSVGSGRSIYEDSTNGGSVELESTRLEAHTARLVAHYKADDHQELDANHLENTRFKDELVSFAAEDNIQLAPDWLLSLGAARHELSPEKVYSIGNPYSLPNKQVAHDAQSGLFYDWSESARVYATIAKKSRLPSLKDRYSQRLGTYIENPALKPEESINYEVGYQGSPWRGATAEAAIFYSDITDKIQSVANVSGKLSQMQNVGKVRSSGVELGLSGYVREWLELGGNYTYIDLENRSDSETKLTDVPKHKFTAFASVSPMQKVELIAYAEHNSSRWASNTLELSGFTTLNLKAAFTPIEGTTLETGVSNLSDQDYALSDGFPSPGRMWFANANYQF